MISPSVVESEGLWECSLSLFMEEAESGRKLKKKSFSGRENSICEGQGVRVHISSEEPDGMTPD